MDKEKTIDLIVDTDFEYMIYTIVTDEKSRIKLIYDEDGYDCEIVKKQS